MNRGEVRLDQRERLVIRGKKAYTCDIRRMVGVALASAGFDSGRDVVVDDGNILRAAQCRLQCRRGEGDEEVGTASDRGVDERGDSGHVTLRVEDFDFVVAAVFEVRFFQAIEYAGFRILDVDDVVVLDEVDLPLVLREGQARGALAMLQIGEKKDQRCGCDNSEADGDSAKGVEHGRRVL